MTAASSQRDDLTARICRRLGIVETEALERFRAASLRDSSGDLLHLLVRAGAIDESAADRVESLLRELEARLGARPAQMPCPTEGLPQKIEIGGMVFDLTPEADPYSRHRVCRMRSDRFDRRVILTALPDSPLSLRELDERIARVKAKAPAEATRVYPIHPIGGVPHLLTACPEGAPLSIVLARLRPDRGRSLVLADSLLDILYRAHQAGLVHGFLGPDSVYLSTSGGLEIADYVRPTTEGSWSIGAGPVACQPPASPRRDVYAAAYLIHSLLRLEPPPESLLRTLADSPPIGLLVDLLRTRNPSQSEGLLSLLARALLPVEAASPSIQDLRDALTGRVPASRLPDPPATASAPAQRRKLLPFLVTIGSLLATLSAPLWFGKIWDGAEHAPADQSAADPGGPILAVAAVPAPLLTAPPHPPPAASAPRSETPSYLEIVEDLAPRAEPARGGEVPSRYQEAVADFPEEPRVWFDRGRVLFRLGRSEEALADFGKTIELAEGRGAPADRNILYDSYLQRSLANYELGRADTILEDLVRAKEILPGRHEAFFLLGRIYDRAGRHETATQLYEDAMSATRDTFSGSLHRGASRYYRGDLEGAEQDLLHALEIGGDSPGPYCFLGRVRADQGRTTDAIAAFRRSLELDPASYEALFYLGKTQLESGDIEGAGRSFLEGVKADPDRPGAYNGLGLVEQEARRHDTAIAFFDKALAVQDEYAPALRNRASVRFHRDLDGDLDAAIRDLRESLRIEPRDTDAFVLLGNALGRQDDLAGAVRAYSEAIDIDPRNARAYHNRGLVYLRHDHRARARNDFLQAADSDPTYDLPRVALGQMALRGHDLAEARSWFEAAVEANPRSADGLDYLGATLALLGRLDDAIAAFDRCLGLAPDDVRALGNRARCLARAHRYPEARRDYDRALELEPGDAELAEERGRLAEETR